MQSNRGNDRVQLGNEEQVCKVSKEEARKDKPWAGRQSVGGGKGRQCRFHHDTFFCFFPIALICYHFMLSDQMGKD